ncbi:MAG TPA: glycosyl transferase family 28, partial [Flavipsychrobacter sp.]
MVAPLDWGLGHTTRCVPVITYLQAKGHSILFAGNQQQCSYISSTFRGIETIYLEGYNVRYASSGAMFMPAIAKQVPAIMQTIEKEHSWLQEMANAHSIDAVISDNRYGLYHSNIPCVIMTHQLSPISGMGSMADNMVRKLHYRMLERFNRCWIVDMPQAPG